VVLRILPEDPTAVPVLASVKQMAESEFDPHDWLIQVVPPFVVRRIESPPTATPVLASANETLERLNVDPLD
jgi:hypothetical protein